MEFAGEDVYPFTSNVEGATVPLDEVRFPCIRIINDGFRRRTCTLEVVAHAPLFFCADTYEANKLLASTNCVKMLNNLISSTKC